MLTLLLLLYLVFRMLCGGWLFYRPWGLWGMPPIWRRPPMRGPGSGPWMGGPGRGMGRFGRF